jgi:2-hydroxy-3-keto-5-methylthiopentenyl-1-phosphate phosphatase
MPAKTYKRILVSDFDGTMTRFDFFEVARRFLPSAADHDYWQDYLDGKISHFEALAAIFGAIQTDHEGMENALARMELDLTLRDSVTRLEAAGWKIIVASAGCDWYIRRLLKKAGLALEVHANPGKFTPENGLELSLPTDSPYFEPDKGIDKEAIVREALSQDSQAAFAGDGRPDIPAAKNINGSRLFARGMLADYFSEKGRPFHYFENWKQIADTLLDQK